MTLDNRLLGLEDEARALRRNLDVEVESRRRLERRLRLLEQRLNEVEGDANSRAQAVERRVEALEERLDGEGSEDDLPDESELGEAGA